MFNQVVNVIKDFFKEKPKVEPQKEYVIIDCPELCDIKIGGLVITIRLRDLLEESINGRKN